MDRQTLRELITELFEEEALLLGGIVAVHPVDDEVVWRLARGLDRLRRRVLQRVERADVVPMDRPRRGNGTEPHPAIEELLRAIHEDGALETVAG
jgi:hypothetical protein